MTGFDPKQLERALRSSGVGLAFGTVTILSFLTAQVSAVAPHPRELDLRVTL
jgi:hypothetical protein